MLLLLFDAQTVQNFSLKDESGFAAGAAVAAVETGASTFPSTCAGAIG
jgi:hypothetical protein